MNELEEHVKGKKVRRTVRIALDEPPKAAEPEKPKDVFPVAERPVEPEKKKAEPIASQPSQVHHHHYTHIYQMVRGAVKGRKRGKRRHKK